MKLLQAVVLSICSLGASIPAFAHCDSLDGPVVADARNALAKRDVTPVLKWVRAEDEEVIRQAFARVIAIRGGSAEVRTIADEYFFETLVRVHRASEGEPFTGLKPAGSTDPGIAAADEALKSGSGKQLAQRVASEVREGVEQRYALVVERAKHAGDSVAAGREYVEAYVQYIHFVESVASLGHGAEPH